MQITKAGLLEVPLASQTLNSHIIYSLFICSITYQQRLTFNYVLLF